MATQVSFQGVFPCDGSLCFQFSDGGAFSVNSFNDGILGISPVGECTIYSLANNIAGCFEEGSNFNGLKAIEFEFKGVCVSINAENADFKKIIQLWNEKIEEIDISYQKEYEEYMKTPEYRAKRAKELKKECRRQNVGKMVKKAIRTEQFQFKDEEARKTWDNFVELHSDNSFGLCRVHHAEYWAKFMQYLMHKHKGVTVAKIAEEAANAADIDYISDYDHGYAAEILSQVWKYGDELREWYNKKYGYEGDGIDNPSILMSK